MRGGGEGMGSVDYCCFGGGGEGNSTGCCHFFRRVCG